jgi:hypothetical protein
MLKRILKAIGRALKALGKSGWAALEDAFDEPGLALSRTLDTAKSIGGAARGTVEWGASLVGAMMPRIGGGGYVPPEPEPEFKRPHSQDLLTRKLPDFVPDMSPSWYAAAAYIMGGKAFEYPGVKEDFAALAKTDPRVHSWALDLSPTERKLVISAGFDAMVSHLKGIDTIDGVRLAGKKRVPDGILDSVPRAKPVPFELADGYGFADIPTAAPVL